MSEITNTRTEQEKRVVPQNTAAEIFQIYYFYYLILNLKDGEMAGYEVKDDIHIEYTLTGHTNLIQIKHTILTDKDGEPKNLTEKDPDLWKTISNWIKVINDKNDNGRDNYNKQIEFIKNTDFSLVSNKQNSTNDFFIKLSEYQKKTIDLKQVIEYLKNLKNKPEKEQSQTDKDIELLLNQDNKWLSLFLSKIQIEQVENIRDKAFTKFESDWKFILPYPEKVFQCYYEELSQIMLSNPFKREPILISKEDYKKGIGKCSKNFFDTPNLVSIKTDYKIPSDIALHPEKQIFIRQIIDLETDFLEENDKSKMLEFTSLRFAAENSLKRWEQMEVAFIKPLVQKEIKNKWEKAWVKIYNRRKKKELKNLSGDELEEEKKTLGEECLNVTLLSSPLTIIQ